LETYWELWEHVESSVKTKYEQQKSSTPTLPKRIKTWALGACYLTFLTVSSFFFADLCSLPLWPRLIARVKLSVNILSTVVSHCGLAIYIKKYIKEKEEL